MPCTSGWVCAVGTWACGGRCIARRILPSEHDTAQVWGRLRAPHGEHPIEKLNTATALIHELTVATRDVDDFAGAGVWLLNPFDQSQHRRQTDPTFL